MSDIKRVSKKQEKRITKSFKELQSNSRLTVGSGNKWFDKSDVVTELFRVEAKTKVKPSKSFSIKKEWLDKVEKEAFETGKTGLLAFSFGDGKDYISMSVDDFLQLINELSNVREMYEED